MPPSPAVESARLPAASTRSGGAVFQGAMIDPEIRR